MKEISFSQLTRFALVPALILSMGTLPNGRAVAAEASGQSPPPARTEGTAPKPQAENPPAEAQVYGLDRLKVEGDKGDIVVSGEELRMNPSATGTVTEALRGASRVQFDYASRSGMTGGEITAPQISINGSRHYENNFTINGMSINNDINPAGYSSDSGFAPSVQPSGDAQSFFMDTDLLESVVVHTENISARYGDFLGGVVDAELRDARGDRWHAVGKVMHTRDQWAQQHYVTPPATGYSTTPNYQPRFSRWQGKLSADGPLPGKFGLVAAYVQSYSEIPIRRSIVGFPEQSQHRRNQAFLTRVNTLGVEGFKGAATFAYAPYDAQMFVASNRNAEVWVNGGGLSLMLEATKEFPMGSWQNKASWNRSNLSRNVNGDTLYQWRKYVGGSLSNPSSYANWGSSTTTTATSQEGIYGDLKQIRDNLAFSSIFDFKPVGPELFRHSVGIGVQEQYVKLSSDSPEGRLMMTAVFNPGVKGEIADGVIEGEQWLSRMTLYEARSRNFHFAKRSLFAEDTINVERVTIRPGLRLSHDDFTRNLDVAPRSFINVDVLDDGRVNVFGGYNRYYGNQVLGRALVVPSYFSSYGRTLVGDTPGPWTKLSDSAASTRRHARLGELKTPYSDEYNAGLHLNFYETNFSFIMVERKNRDQIRSHSLPSTHPDYALINNEYTNAGRTNYWGVTFLLARSFDLGAFGLHNLNLGATRSITRGNSTSWGDSYDNDPSSSTLYNPDFVWMNGGRIAREDIPANNFNAPWVVAYTHGMSFWEKRLRITGVLRWEQGGPRVVVASPAWVPDPDNPALRLNAYETRNMPATGNVDMTVEFDALRYQDHSLTMIMQINNLIDRENLFSTSDSGSDSGVHRMGRQFFAGMRAEF